MRVTRFAPPRSIADVPVAQRAESLAILARFPEPGRAKTRLIPALGPEGAAALHDQLVRCTLAVVGELLEHRAVCAGVWTTGAAPAEFAAHFDTRLPCIAQCDGDLGARMRCAFEEMLRASSAGVLIGTDCPDLSAIGIMLAFEALRRCDLVLGPAQDGGYYLIGMRRPAPELFEGVAWSSSSVLATTLERAASLGLSVELLPTLSDVDEPQDLADCGERHAACNRFSSRMAAPGVIMGPGEAESISATQHARHTPPAAWPEAHAAGVATSGPPSLSVVVATLNEADRIGATLDSLRVPGVEVVVADGGSGDQTAAIAAVHGARVLIVPRGRGVQLNAGAALARGRSLLFLHADTTLPAGFASMVERALDDPRTAVGAFRFGLDRRGVLLRAVELAVRVRCDVFGLPYGDQALFMRREAFIALGGFAALPLMEDLDLVRRARRFGRVQMLAATARTSSRRWRRAGVFRMTAINQACVLGHLLGVPATRLATWRERCSRARAVGSERS